MKNLKSLLALLFAIALLAAACGSDDDAASDDASADDAAEASDDSSDDDAASDDEADEGDDDAMADDEGEADVDLSQGGDLTFHMITHSEDGPFWSVVKKGMDAACEDVDVSCVWMPGNNDPTQMVTDIQTAIGEGSSGIAASLPSPDQLIPELQKAVAEGIPVYTLNSGANDYGTIGATTHVGQSEDVAGEGAGLRFNDLGATKVLCGRQEQSNVGLEERCNGLKATFDGEVVDEFVGLDADQTEQINGVKAILEADPDIDGFLGVGPVIAMSGLQAATDLGRDLHIGGFDMTPELLDAIEAGDIAFTVDQQQYLQGYLPIILMYLEVTNQNQAGGGLPILTGPGFVTPDNAAAVKELSAAGTR